jgi:hypothetical protein
VENPIRKASVKEIAGSRGVHDSNFIGGSIPEAGPIPSERTVYAEGRANGERAVFSLKLRERFKQVLLSGCIARKFLRGDGIVDERKKTEKPWRHVIQIGDDWDSRGACPGSGNTCGGRVVPVDVQ